MSPMTLPEQIDAFANAPDYASKVCQSRDFFKAVSQLIRKLEADAARKVCANCGEHPAYRVPGERTDAPGYAMMERAAIDRMHDMAAATRSVL